AGGHLILSGEEGVRLFGNQPPAWTGIAGWAFGKEVRATVQQPGHLLAKGLAGVDRKDPAWTTTTTAVASPGALSVIGAEGRSLLLVAEHGKGKVVYMGGKLLPQERPAYQERAMVHDLSPLAIHVWHNLTDFLATPERETVIHVGLAQLPGAGQQPL